MHKGYIYKATNRLNGKSYIGKTINFELRQHRHRTGKSKYHFGCAIAKYGEQNFDFEVIATLELEDIELFNKQLSELEIFYIAKYDTYNNGYNSTIGGEGTVGYHYTIEQKKSMSDRMKAFYSIPENRIKLQQRTKEAMKKLKGKSRDRQIVMKGAVKRRKPILQYSIDGVFIKEYPSLSSIVDYNGINIGKCCKGEIRSAYGYAWKYKKDNIIPLQIEPVLNPHITSRKVLQYSEEGTFISEYDCVNQAVKEVGVSRSALANCLAGQSCSCGGYKWKYKEAI